MFKNIIKFYSMLSGETKQTINMFMGFIAMAITIGTVFIIAGLFVRLFIMVMPHA